MRFVPRFDGHSRVSGVKTVETPEWLRRSMASADVSTGWQVCFTPTLGATPQFLRKLATNSGFQSSARRAYSNPPERIHAGVLRRAEVAVAAGIDGTRSP